jgi:lipopolysaccharide export system protein LptA
MSKWQRPVRFGLAAFVVSFAIAVFLGVRQRAEPTPAVVIELADPDALIQSRGARIIQSDESAEDVRITAGHQLTYPDGALRLTDGVEVAVAARSDREAFAFAGSEAFVDGAQSEVRFTGGVHFESANGLTADAREATYLDSEDIVRMPGEVRFARHGMMAGGIGAEYDQRRDVLTLERAARVELVGADSRMVIDADRATLAQTDGYMVFDGGVAITAAQEQMRAERARVTFAEAGVDTDPGADSVLTALQLDGDARIIGSDQRAGRLREMSADDIGLTYGEAGQTLEAATLRGRASVDLYGDGGGPGSRITGRTMDLAFGADGDGVAGLSAFGDVTLSLPASTEGSTQRVTAESLTVSDIAAGTSMARFDGGVEYRETRPAGADGSAVSRVTRAQRLEAGLGQALASFETTRFLGDVVFEDGAVSGEADEARYAVGSGALELITMGSEGRVPRLVDTRGSIQAKTITVTTQGQTINAVGEVECILSGEASAAAAGESAIRPGMLSGDAPVYVTAGRLNYDSETAVATYTGGARLWQGDTLFNGTRIVMDESTGGFTATGNVRTRSLFSQIDDETGLQEESVTIGHGGALAYDNTLRQITYSVGAGITGPRGTMKASVIDLFLQADSKTLERIEAVGAVQLEMVGRWVKGDELVYYDADGRYEMQGEPVEITEEADGTCRTTTGRTLTFFITAEAVSIDGQSEVRTETSSGACPISAIE